MKKHNKLIIFISLFVLLLGTNSCRILRPSEMFITKEEDFPTSEFKVGEKEYKIKPFDKLSMRIITNDGEKLINIGDQNGNNNSNNYLYRNPLDYLVEFDGQVKLPTLGRVYVAGMKIREAEQFLEKEYSEYFNDPFVLIEVTNRKVMIFKDGGTIGTVLTIPPENLTLIEALAKSGGITDISKAYRIKLIRGDVSGEPKVYYFNASHLKELKNTNLLLEANDIIYVESKPKYVNRVLIEITPYLTLLTTGLAIYGLFIKK